MAHRLSGKSFSVRVDCKRVLFDEYIKLCKKHDIDYAKGWNGSGTHYGIRYDDSRDVALYSAANPTVFGDHHFSTMEEFQNFLEPNINDFSII